MNQPRAIDFGASAAPAPIADSQFTELVAKPINMPVVESTHTYAPPAVIVTDKEIDEIGGDLGSNASKTTSKILASVKATDTDKFGADLNQLIATAKGLDPQKMKGGFLAKVFGAMSGTKEKLMAQYENVDQRMDALIKEMDKQSKLMVTRTDDLEVMFEENYQTFNALEKEKLRGEQLLARLNESIEQRKGNVTDAFDIQRLADDQARAARLEKRIDDLGRSMQLARLAAPEIRQMQGHARSLVSNFRDIKDTTIPAWKSVFSRYIIGQEVKKSAQLQTSISDATNEAFRMQADQMRENTVAIATIQQRSIVDIETLEHMQTQLLGSIDDAIRIANEGKKARQEALPKLQNLEKELINRFSTPQLSA